MSALSVNTTNPICNLCGEEVKDTSKVLSCTPIFLERCFKGPENEGVDTCPNCKNRFRAVQIQMQPHQLEAQEYSPLLIGGVDEDDEEDCDCHSCINQSCVVVLLIIALVTIVILSSN